MIVGRKGSGKTNLLSIIADALIRAASAVFTDVVTPYGGTGQSYFRLLGGRALTYREPGGFSILRFADGTDEYFYTENTGYFSTEDASELIPGSLEPGAKWNSNEQSKKFNIPKEKIGGISKAVFTYTSLQVDLNIPTG